MISTTYDFRELVLMFGLGTRLVSPRAGRGTMSKCSRKNLLTVPEFRGKHLSNTKYEDSSKVLGNPGNTSCLSEDQLPKLLSGTGPKRTCSLRALELANGKTLGDKAVRWPHYTAEKTGSEGISDKTQTSLDAALQHERRLLVCLRASLSSPVRTTALFSSEPPKLEYRTFSGSCSEEFSSHYSIFEHRLVGKEECLLNGCVGNEKKNQPNYFFNDL